MTRVLHTSDLHGRYKPLLAFDQELDVWVDTGDFFPNKGRRPGTGFQILAEFERRYQVRWLHLKKLHGRLAAWLRGRPAVTIPGNHDFLCLAQVLQSAGADAHRVEPRGVEVAGLTWAGFREIPAMDGEWPGETDDFSAVVDQVWRTKPDVLVTHAPAEGILDGTDGYGVPELGMALRTRGHRLRAHLFGHEHEDGGKRAELDGVLHHNGATRMTVWRSSPQSKCRPEHSPVGGNARVPVRHLPGLVSPVSRIPVTRVPHGMRIGFRAVDP